MPKILAALMVVLLTVLVFSGCPADPFGTTGFFISYYANGASGSAPTDENIYAAGYHAVIMGNNTGLNNPGYSFDCWNTASDGSGTDYEPGAVYIISDSDLKLYAKWILNPGYSVTYKSNKADSGSVPEGVSWYKEFDEVRVACNLYELEREGYSFVGWNTNEDGSGIVYSGGASFIMNNEDLVLYAMWSQKTVYRVSYDAADAESGEVPTDSNLYEEGFTVTVSNNIGGLDRDGYILEGWRLVPGEGEILSTDSTFSMGAGDAVLYAVWSLGQTYTLTYHAPGVDSGAVPEDSGIYKENDDVDILGNSGMLEKADCFFIGWSTCPDGTGVVLHDGESFKMGVQNIDLYACWAEPVKYLDADGDAGDRFGFNAVVSENYMAVGSDCDDGIDGLDYGSVTVYRSAAEGGWTLEAKLMPPVGGSAQDYFGRGLAVSEDYLAAGAPGPLSKPGIIYLYERSGDSWNYSAELTASDSAADDRYGRAVAISGDNIIVGAFKNSSSGTEDNGAVYFHKKTGDGWGGGQKLLASDKASSDNLGLDVDICGSYAIAGAYTKSQNGFDNTGAAYVFYNDGAQWVEQAVLTAPDGGADDRFGYNVAINGEYAAVGMIYDDDEADNAGAVWIFRHIENWWMPVQKLTASDALSDDKFGTSVNVCGDYMTVGAEGDSSVHLTSGKGRVYIFRLEEQDHWVEIGRVGDPDGYNDDRFGYVSDISSHSVVIGAFFDDDTAGNAGSVFTMNYR